MLFTRPMPDELAVAHEGRLAMLNDRADVLTLYTLLEAELAGRGLDPLRFPKLHQLAIVSGLTPQAYARLHTLLPAIRVACREGDDAPYGSETSRLSKARIRRSPQTIQAHCCTRCIEEDLRQWGFSWFRRFHHVRGFDWCPVHRNALSVVESPHPFRGLPHQWLHQGKTTPIQIAEEELAADGVLDRYVSIYMALLDRERPVLRSFIHPRLVAAAKNRGLATSAKPNLFRLSDLVAKVVPERWLNRHIASWHQKIPRTYFQHVDVPLNSVSATAAADAFVLAAAVLLPSAGEAIGLLNSSPSSTNHEAPVQRAPAGGSGEVMVA